MKKLFPYLSIIFILFAISLHAQTTKEELLSDTRYVGGLYCPYIFTNNVSTQAPKGYTPFYISYYGRHGSRWVLSNNSYVVTKEILGKADNGGKLTALGKNLFEKIKIAADDALDRYGDLAPLGVKEQKGIAERMYKSFPEVFSTKDGRNSFIYSRSTQVPRCILSMAAYNEKLKELNPKIEIVREATKKNNYLNNDPEINKDTNKAIVSAFIKKNTSPDRFISSIFNDTAFVNKNIKDKANFAYLIYSIAINMANIDYLNISMLDVFTKNELFILWQISNLQMYLEVGPSAVNGKSTLKSASLLLNDIVHCADKAIKNQNISADLRFGHDSYIIPLLALMDIKGMNVQEPDPDKVYLAWSNFKASPMSSNLQIIFYKNNKNDDILVKLLLNEKEVEVPVKSNVSPYYNWKELKAYYEKKISG